MRKAEVDFLVIGAAKSGTTSLYKYLAAHPSIYIPQEKEVGFFNRSEYVARGVEFYLSTWFSKADPTCLWGDVSPQYMYYESAAEVIQELMPQTKLIALLRNPIDRAYSHYQFATRRNVETEPFKVVMQRLIDRGTVDDATMRHNNRNGFREHVAAGQYGRILQNYFDRFSREQMRVVFFEDFVADPEVVTRDICAWLGVDSAFETDVFGKRFMTGGTPRWPMLRRLFDKSYKVARGIPFVPEVAQKVVHRSQIHAFRRWFLHELTVVPGDLGGPTPQQRELLRSYYASDVQHLEEMLGQSAPWADFAPAPTLSRCTAA